jgi:hypothetical protein
MGLTSRDKEQLLGVLSIFAPIIERTLVRTAEAPMKEQLFKAKMQSAGEAGGYPVGPLSQILGENLTGLVPPGANMIPSDMAKPLINYAAAKASQGLTKEKIDISKGQKEVDRIADEIKRSEDILTKDSFMLEEPIRSEFKNVQLNAAKRLPELKKRYQQLTSKETTGGEVPEIPGITYDKLAHFESLSQKLEPRDVMEIANRLAQAEQGYYYGPNGYQKNSNALRLTLADLEKFGLKTPTDVRALVEYYKQIGKWK